MVVNQGDIYWVSLKEPNEAKPGYTHPHVVIQDDILNRSRINTVVVCALTTNSGKANAPGECITRNRRGQSTQAKYCGGFAGNHSR
jgi:mRNA interferase MazF